MSEYLQIVQNTCSAAVSLQTFSTLVHVNIILHTHTGCNAPYLCSFLGWLSMGQGQRCALPPTGGRF